MTGTSRAGVTLTRIDGKREVIVDRKYVRENVELAYASTLDSAQGITVQRAVFVVSEGIGNTGLYSATTRGKQAPIYLVVTDSDAENPAEQARERLTKSIQTDDKAENALTFKNERPALPAFAWETTITDTPETPAAEAPAATPEPSRAPVRIDAVAAIQRARAEAVREMTTTPPAPRRVDANAAIRLARAQAAREMLTRPPAPAAVITTSEPPEPPPWEPPSDTWEPPAP